MNMAIRKVIQIGHPALKAKNKRISDFKTSKLNKLIKDLRDTMKSEEIIGIAASQIGENYKVFVTQPRKTKDRKNISDKLRVYINPKISFYSEKKSIIYEGCGSVLNGTLFGPVKRPKEVEIIAFDKKARKFKLRCDGILARVIQHEYDHLFGIEFLEKISDYKELMTADYYRKKIRNSKEQISASVISINKFEYI